MIVHAAIPTDVPLGSSIEGVIRIEPNPARENAVIHYRVGRDGTAVRLMIYDVTGRLVSTLRDDVSSSGSHHATWNGRRGEGGSASAGIYFVVLEIGNRREAGKLVLLR